MTHALRNPQRFVVVARQLAVGIVTAVVIATPAAGILTGSPAPGNAGRGGHIEITAADTSAGTSTSVRGVCLTAASHCI